MRRIFAVLPLMIVFFTACNEDGLSTDFVAGEVFTDSNIRVVLIDTISVAMSTMKFDSIVTSQSSRILVGKYSDPVFGEVQSSNYAQLLPDTYTIDTEAEYDSIVFYLDYDEYYYNDTLQQSNIHIKKLDEQLSPPDDSNFYNTSSISYLDEDLGQLSFSPRPLLNDSLEIRLDDAFGVELFENLQEKTITNSDELTAYLPGIAIKPGDTDNGSVLGFSTETSVMRLYFSTSGEDERIQEYIDFEINTSSSPLPFFNQINTEGEISELQSLTDHEINLNSSESENQCYIQSGIGIATRIQFPSIKSIYDIPGEGTILDAVLKIKPVEGTYDDLLILREGFSVYQVDQNNDLTAQLYATDGNTVEATLNTDAEEFNDIYFEIPLGSYIENLFLADRDDEGAIILLPSDYTTSVDRYILNDSSHYQTNLELTYAIYDEDE